MSWLRVFALVLLAAWAAPQLAWAFADVDTCSAHCDDDAGDIPCPPFASCCQCAARTGASPSLAFAALDAPLWTPAPRALANPAPFPPEVQLAGPFRPPRRA